MRVNADCDGRQGYVPRRDHATLIIRASFWPIPDLFRTVPQRRLDHVGIQPPVLLRCPAPSAETVGSRNADRVTPYGPNVYDVTTDMEPPHFPRQQSVPVRAPGALSILGWRQRSVGVYILRGRWSDETRTIPFRVVRRSDFFDSTRWTLADFEQPSGQAVRSEKRDIVWFRAEDAAQVGGQRQQSGPAWWKQSRAVFGRSDCDGGEIVETRDNVRGLSYRRDNRQSHPCCFEARSRDPLDQLREQGRNHEQNDPQLVHALARQAFSACRSLSARSIHLRIEGRSSRRAGGGISACEMCRPLLAGHCPPRAVAEPYHDLGAPLQRARGQAAPAS